MKGKKVEMPKPESLPAKVLNIAGQTYEVGSFGYQLVEMLIMVNIWTIDATSDFSKFTTPTVTAVLGREFRGHPEALAWIEKQYALHNLNQLLGADTQKSAGIALSFAGSFDPTGILGVVNAFNNPRCSMLEPFPKITILK
jgi:hypothetical protein